jgi:chitinase
LPGPTGPASSTKHFTLLLKEMRAATTTAKLLLTAALQCSTDAQGYYQLGEVHKYLDWINLMCYDYHGKWETGAGAVANVHVRKPWPRGQNAMHSSEVRSAASATCQTVHAYSGHMQAWKLNNGV